MIDYQTAKETSFAKGTIPDGHFGERRDVTFCLNYQSGVILAVASCGYFRFLNQRAMDQGEALWLLRNHPESGAKDVEVI